MAKYKKRADGRYQAAISVGRDDSGKIIYKVVYGKTIAELEDKIIDVKSNLKNHTYIKDSNTLLSNYATFWFETYKSKKSINTVAMYRNLINKHIKPDIGHFKLSEITRSDIQAMITSRSDHYETCRKIIMCLKQIFKAAISDKLLIETPCKDIELPAKPRSNKRALTSDEKQAIKLADFTQNEKAFVYLLFYFGLRRGEALAVMSNDFDFDKCILKINKSIVFDKNNPNLCVTKNATSDRELPIPSEAYGFFKSYTPGKLYLITKTDNTLVTHSSYVKMWQSIVKKMNNALTNEKASYKRICGLTAHIFRHNYATMLYYSCITTKKAAQLLGHTDTKMIMEVYAHLDDEQENVKDKLDVNVAL